VGPHQECLKHHSTVRLLEATAFEGTSGTHPGGGGHHLLLAALAVDEAQSGLGEDFEAEVAALLDPFAVPLGIVLLGEHGAYEADRGAPVGKLLPGS
jgi:hypothetical protein